MATKYAVIIGAGPAGLTAAYELLQRKTDIIPLVVEQADFVGGIARTYDFNGFKMDMGGHRFYSSDPSWMQWWQKILPLEDASLGRKAEATEDILLLRPRHSHILYQRKLFRYPVTLSLDTVFKLGLPKLIWCGLSYLKACWLPRPEKSLADFMINRFGRALYATFFRDYTQKVWGVPCEDLPPDWGGQRIKGISLKKVFTSAWQQAAERWRRRWPGNSSANPPAASFKEDLGQKGKEVSFIDCFVYPKYGPGQLWEKVAQQISAQGGIIHLNTQVVGLQAQEGKITGVVVQNNNSKKIIPADYVLSSMPLKDLMRSLLVTPEIAATAQEAWKIAQGLVYRDFRTVGLRIRKDAAAQKYLAKDTWIYVQEKDVQLGRIQVFNNWSPYLLPSFARAREWWLGLEYFCNEGDALWSRTATAMVDFASNELIKLGLIKEGDVLGGCSLRVAKAYPSYFGTYPALDVLKKFLGQFTNLYLIGRNGTHQYNNMDRSMATAAQAVEQLLR